MLDRTQQPLSGFRFCLLACQRQQEKRNENSKKSTINRKEFSELLNWQWTTAQSTYSHTHTHTHTYTHPHTHTLTTFCSQMSESSSRLFITKVQFCSCELRVASCSWFPWGVDAAKLCWDVSSWRSSRSSRRRRRWSRRGMVFCRTFACLLTMNLDKLAKFEMQTVFAFA